MTAAASDDGTDARLERERRFHDERFGADEARSSDRFYVVNDECAAAYETRVLRLGAGNRVLEIGCGLNSPALALAAMGAQVIGIDISPVAIDEARERAEGVENVRFEVMDAEALTVDDGSLDLVIGTGILHHLDLSHVSDEIRRVLAPGGRAVFVEPLGHNPLINLYRRLTPGERTVDEHPLLTSDFALLRERFGSVECTSYVFVTLGAIPFRRFSFFGRLTRVLQRVDRTLLRLRWLQPLAWTVLIELSRPVPGRAPVDRDRGAGATPPTQG